VLRRPFWPLQDPRSSPHLEGCDIGPVSHPHETGADTSTLGPRSRRAHVGLSVGLDLTFVLSVIGCVTMSSGGGSTVDLCPQRCPRPFQQHVRAFAPLPCASGSARV
jgi:hypothetical protein